MPLSTLRLKPRGVNRKTQGQDAVRFLLSCKALSSSTTCRFTPAHVAVGTPIARYPPHKTVRALLRIRLPPWICGVKACHGIRMQDTRKWNPSVEERIEPLPTHIAALTAMDKYHPPQSAKPMSEDLQLRQVTRNGVVSVVTRCDLL